MIGYGGLDVYVYFALIASLIVGVGVFSFYYWGVYEDGVMAGKILRISKKGVVFKTYEGKLIQSGFRSKVAGTIQSNEFDFSVINERIAQQLMVSGGKEVELHYKEYLHSLPWRGYNKYIVDSVIAIRPPTN